MPRLHRSSWVIGIFTTLACLIVVFPGQIEDYHFANSPIYLHGWPARFLERRTHESLTATEYDPATGQNLSLVLIADPAWLPPPDMPPWMSPGSWQIWHGTKWRWHIPALLFDLLMVLCVPLAITAGWEWRRRRTSRLLQFRMADLLLAMTTLAIFLVWIMHHVRSAATEQQAAATILNVISMKTRNQAPNWFKRLVGTQLTEKYFTRISEVYLDYSSFSRADDLASGLSKLEYLETLSITAHRANSSIPFDTLLPLRNLRTLKLGTTSIGESRLSPSEIDGLAKLTQLTTIYVSTDDAAAYLREKIGTALPNSHIVSEIE